MGASWVCVEPGRSEAALWACPHLNTTGPPCFLPCSFLSALLFQNHWNVGAEAWGLKNPAIARTEKAGGGIVEGEQPKVDRKCIFPSRRKSDSLIYP